MNDNQKYFIKKLPSLLLESGLEFFHRSIEEFEKGNHKYSIIFFSSGIEVVLKSYIVLQSWEKIIRVTKKQPADIDLLMRGKAKTIGVYECIKMICDELKLNINHRGNNFEIIAEERNKAIHYYLPNNTSQLESVQYNAFEDMFFFLIFNKAEVKGENYTSLKILLKKLGKHHRFANNNLIEQFIEQLDKKGKQLLDKIKLLKIYRKGIIQQLLKQEIYFKDTNQELYKKWKTLRLGDICEIHKNKRVTSNLELVFIKDKFILKKDNRQKGIFIAKIADLKFISTDFLALLVETLQINLHRSSQGIILKNINISDLKSMPVKVPSIYEQKIILNFIHQIDNKIEQTQEQLELFLSYEQSLKQKMYV